MAQKRPPEGKSVRITISVTKEFAEHLRNAVYWTPGVTLTSLIEEAVGRRLAKLEEARGAPFPVRSGRLHPGKGPPRP